MKVKRKKLVEVVVGRVCDVCEQALTLDIAGQSSEEGGELSARWGYGSKQDGKVYHLDLCEQCFTVALLALIDQRKLLMMTDKTLTPPNENFGVALDRSN
jgi:hypothetical protein